MTSLPVVRTAARWRGSSDERVVVVHLPLLPVAALGLEEDDGVVGRDRLLNHAVAVGGVARGHDAQPGRVGEVGLGRLRVVLDRTDPTTEGNANGEGNRDAALVAVTQLGHLGDDLVEGGVDEAVELNLAHRPVPAHGQTDGRADDAGLGQRRIDDAAVTEVALQSLGDTEHSPELADVLPHQDDLGVALHGLAQPAVQRLAQGHGRHHESSSNPAR